MNAPGRSPTCSAAPTNFALEPPEQPNGSTRPTHPLPVSIVQLGDNSDLYAHALVYTERMAKHLIDIDEDALRAARTELGTQTIKETVNRALRQAGGRDRSRVKRSLDRLARAKLAAREDAWR